MNNIYFDEAINNWHEKRDMFLIELVNDDKQEAYIFFRQVSDLLKWFLNWIRDEGYWPEFDTPMSLDNLFAHLFFLSAKIQERYYFNTGS